MAAKTASGQELLKQAIKSEIDGRRYYAYLAEKTTNTDARRKLTNLAKDESRHEAVLITIYRKIYGEEVGEIPKKGIGVLSKFFDHAEGKEGMTEVQYIALAIEAELAATNCYKEEAKTAPTEEIRKIFEGMAAEEFSHYELLQAEKSALSGGYYWFGYGDGAPLEE
jgi:rubrerythrin